MKSSYRPKSTTIIKVVNYLESLGLNVYGNAIDVNKGLDFKGGCMDYTGLDIVKLRNLIAKEKKSES